MKRIGRPPRDMRDRLYEKIMYDTNGGCWLFTGCLDWLGYGAFQAATSRTARAHVVMYELVHGPVPSGLQLDHKCRVRSCINPAHLEPVTARENTLRGFGPSAANARKTHCLRGHELSGDNLAKSKRQRVCQTCVDERERRLHAPMKPPITAFGRTMTMSEWAAETGILLPTLSSRLNQLGWNVERALSKGARCSPSLQLTEEGAA